jgi:hypothetical protein
LGVRPVPALALRRLGSLCSGGGWPGRVPAPPVRRRGPFGTLSTAPRHRCCVCVLRRRPRRALSVRRSRAPLGLNQRIPVGLLPRDQQAFAERAQRAKNLRGVATFDSAQSAAGRARSVGVRRPSHGSEMKRDFSGGRPDGPRVDQGHTGDGRKRTKEGMVNENNCGRVPVQTWASPSADVCESRCRRVRVPVQT